MIESEYEGKFLSTKDIEKIHSDIIQNSEVKDSEGFIDITGARFESAVSSIFAGFYGIEMYPTVLEKAVRLCYNIINCHCFMNANKRTALMSMLSTLEINGIKLKYNQNEMYNAICKVGSGELSYEDLLEYIKSCVCNISLETKKCYVQ